MAKKEFSAAEAKGIGNKIGVKWGEGKEYVRPDQFKMGLGVELEHGSKLGSKTNVTKDDPIKTGKITLAHLLEDGQQNYYTDLKHMEEMAKKREALAKSAAALLCAAVWSKSKSA